MNDLPMIYPLDLGPAAITEIDLPDETDRGFVTADGFMFRAKVQRCGEHVTRPVPNNVEGNVAPTTRTYSISLAELDSEKKVKKDKGALLISDAYEITVTDEQLANPDWSLSDAIMEAVQHFAKAVEMTAQRREGDIAEAEAAWGIE